MDCQGCTEGGGGGGGHGCRKMISTGGHGGGGGIPFMTKTRSVLIDRRSKKIHLHLQIH